MKEMQKLLTNISDREGADALNSFLLTADRGYRKEAYVEIMGNLDLSS